MAERALDAQRLVALFVVGCLLFSYPVMSLFNVAATWAGIPVLYAYLFGAWAGLIVLMMLIAERRG